MQKPTTLLIAEFRKQVEIALNNSGLPWWKVRDELQYVFLPQAQNLAMREEQLEMEEYQKYVQAENEKKLEEKRKQRIDKKGSDKNATI